MALSACGHALEPRDKAARTVESLVTELETQYAPDRRTAVWEAAVEVIDGQIVIKGKTDNKKVPHALESALAQKGLKADVQMLVLPDAVENADKNPWAVVSVPVASMTGRPGFAVPLTTQALFGTPLRVLDYQRPFWRVQMPDGYIGWVHGLQIVRLSQQELSEWNKSEKVIVIKSMAAVRDAAGSVILTLGVGSIVRFVGMKDGGVCVELPDGRLGYVAQSCVRLLNSQYESWIRTSKEGQEAFRKNIIKTAKDFLGTSYLWGGTSVSGMDCSGFVSLVWRLNGVILSRDADQQLAQARKMDFEDVEEIPAGLLLGFGKKGENGRHKIEHIGISLGGGDFIHSLGSVRIESLSRKSSSYSAYEAGRFLGAYELDAQQNEVPCATTFEDNGFYQSPPRRLRPCRLHF